MLMEEKRSKGMGKRSVIYTSAQCVCVRVCTARVAERETGRERERERNQWDAGRSVMDVWSNAINARGIERVIF